MDDNYFIPSSQNLNGKNVPAPLIRHSDECKQHNIRRKMRRLTEEKTEIKKKAIEMEKTVANIKNEKDKGDIEVKEEEEKEEEAYDKYMCININKYNRMCYENIIPLLDDTHLNFSLGESLMYVANFYLQKKIINKQLYNRILHSFQMALIEVLSEVSDDKKNKWNLRGKLINIKKENKLSILYVENASLSVRTIKIHIPLLKIKAIDL